MGCIPFMYPFSLHSWHIILASGLSKQRKQGNLSVFFMRIRLIKVLSRISGWSISSNVPSWVKFKHWLIGIGNIIIIQSASFFYFALRWPLMFRPLCSCLIRIFWVSFVVDVFELLPSIFFITGCLVVILELWCAWCCFWPTTVNFVFVFRLDLLLLRICLWSILCQKFSFEHFLGLSL